MRRARCYFPYLKNANALNGLKNGAMEALVNIQDTRVAGSLSTIMGIEGNSSSVWATSVCPGTRFSWP